MWSRLLESQEIASHSTPVPARKARGMLLPSHQECPVICDPSNGAKRARRHLASRLIPFVVAAGGLLMALSGVSDAKPPTLPDLLKTVPTKKQGPNTTRRSNRRVARPNPRSKRPDKRPIPRPQPTGPLARLTSLPRVFPYGGASLTLGGAEIDFATIPGGEFMMGALASDSAAQSDEKPAHRVRISAFELGSTEVTVGQFQAYCRAARKSMPKQEAWNNTIEHPVHNVSWNDATGYCTWATNELKRAGIPGTIRLPTEAEWEYAARGGATGIDGKPLHKYPWGDQAQAGGDGLVNFEGNGDGYEQTAPVGRFKPNGSGLRDMAGNVWEWCQDRYDEGCYAKSRVENPQGSQEAKKPYRVLRGGSWNNSPDHLRASTRGRDVPDYRFDDLGFRLARTLRP